MYTRPNWKVLNPKIALIWRGFVAFCLNLKFKIFKSKILFSFRHASPEAQYWCHQSQSWRGVAFITFWSGVKIPDFFDFFKHFFSRHQECVFSRKCYLSSDLPQIQFFHLFSFLVFALLSSILLESVSDLNWSRPCDLLKCC